MNITSADVDKYPEFMNLLKSLSRHMTPTGMSVSAQQDITEVQCHARTAFQHTLCIGCILPYRCIITLPLYPEIRF